MNRTILLAACAAAAVGLAAGPAAAQSARIGMITTLSGAGSAPGIDIRDGFELAVKQGGGRLGGVAIELIVADDARKPETAKQIAERMVKRDKVDIMTGIVWSNLAMAVVPGVTRGGTFYISPNAGPSALAGKACNENYFNVAWQNDNLHEAMGQHVTDKGFKNVYLLAPDYPAGREALAGFKRYYKGALAGEVYTRLGQTDYAAEISALRAARPDAVFFFLPGGMGINFLKQYDRSGLKGAIPIFGPAFSFDETILKPAGKAAEGVFNSSQWNADIRNSANIAFVADFVAEYGRYPSLYASQGYDAARLIGSALAATGGDMSKTDAFRDALRAAKFDSVRGAFKFGPNQHPIQDIYVRQVYTDASGRLTNRIVGKIFEDHQDAYAVDCKM
jgi:branched-chain amino acid transport system substrate-binding protein